MIEKDGLSVERQKAVNFEYEGIAFNEGFRVDLLVENRVVIKLLKILGRRFGRNPFIKGFLPI